MQHRFSEQLIKRLQTYWKTRTGEDISDTTADEYLNGFADLYGSFMAFADPKYETPVIASKRPVAPTLERGGRDALRLAVNLT